jgi:dTDP-N-acetylfucosamine:lipid II N-acetylfucosaminyltransferase
MRILHIATEKKFIIPLMNIVNDDNNHRYIILTKKENIKQNNILFLNKRIYFLKLLYALNNCDKIILHGLFSDALINILFFQPWLTKKCYWFMLGGDFYNPKKQSFIKRKFIKKIKNFVTYIKGDFEYVKKIYGCSGELFECFMYPSNLSKNYTVNKNLKDTINIQVGNSADPTNNHMQVFDFLRKFKNDNIKIFTPLSYGNNNYAKLVISKGKNIFGDKFIPMLKFKENSEYLNFLTEIDIAIFAHDRQQAMGNIITLLGMGKKVYMKSNITPWILFSDIGVKAFDFNDISLDLIDSKMMNQNINKIKSYFSKESYVQQLESIFNKI